MGFDLDIQVEEWTNEDRSWLASRLGMQENKSITLDLSLFDWVTDFPDHVIPSGVALAKRTSTGYYGPYAHTGPTNEIQTITRTATGGTFTLNVDGETTAGIDATASVTAAVIQAAINLLSNVDQDHTITIAGSAGGPFSCTFGGLWAAEDVPLMIQGGSPTGGTVVVSTPTPGAPEAGDPHAGLEIGRGLLFNTQPRIGDGTGLVGAPLFWYGRVDESELPATSGVDADFKVDVPTLHFE